MTPFIISSRPDNTFNALSGFEQLSIAPLTLELAIRLIEQLEYDKATKEKFTKELANGVFERHESFLSNPLLLTIMLMTYGDCADIPQKMCVFYEHAYCALFSKHDAFKGSYKRCLKTRLDILDFGKLFSAFCIKSYEDRALNFSEEKAISYIKMASRLSGIPCDPKDYLSDTVQSLCLLLEDGIYYTFAHRSFQEYFAAKYILMLSSDLQCQILEKYINYINQDTIFSLLFEMDKSSLEANALLPFADRCIDELKIKGELSQYQYKKIIKSMFATFRVTKALGATVMILDKAKRLYFIELVSFMHDKYFPHDRSSGNRSKAYALSAIIRKHGMQDGEEYVVQSSKLPLKHDFFSDLSVANWNFNYSSLNLFFKTISEIRAKHKNTQKTLESILGLK